MEPDVEDLRTIARQHREEAADWTRASDTAVTGVVRMECGRLARAAKATAGNYERMAQREELKTKKGTA